jgi:hypothetical protein
MIFAVAAFGMHAAAQNLRFAPVPLRTLKFPELIFECWSPQAAGKKMHFDLIIQPLEHVYWIGIGDSPLRNLLNAPIKQAAVHNDGERHVFRLLASDSARHAHATVLVTLDGERSASLRLRTSRASYEARCTDVLPPKAERAQ